MGAWAGMTIAQDTFLGWMSSADGFNYFVNTVLPDVLTGAAKVLNPAGSDLGPVAPIANLIMATQDDGSKLGLTIPTSILQAAQNPPAPPAPAAAIPVTTDPNQSAKDIINQDLANWGLGDLTNMTMDLLTKGSNSDQVIAAIRGTDQYKQRFAGNVQRQAAGLTPLSEGQYLAYEDQARQVMKAAGMPAGFYDSPSDFAGLIGKDVSASELNSRVQLGMTLATQEPPEVQAEAARLGLTLSDQAAGILDPDAALPILQQKLSMAQIGGASVASGYGQLDAGTLQGLAAYGVTEQQARQGFGNIEQLKPLLTTNPGEEAITQQQALRAQFENDADAQAALSRRQRLRLAAFSGAGGPNVTSKGVSGLGTAATTAS